jgi:hypothetical protein
MHRPTGVLVEEILDAAASTLFSPRIVLTRFALSFLMCFLLDVNSGSFLLG